MHFCHIFGFLKLLTRRENDSQKGITGWDFSYQNLLPNEKMALKKALPDEILALKITYQT